MEEKGGREWTKGELIDSGEEIGKDMKGSLEGGGGRGGL